MKNKNIFKKFGYSIFANIISLVTSSLLVIIIPKFISNIDYGYWQLYLFYVGYIGLLQFGFCDGIYLRYGGEEYANLDKKKFSNQFFVFTIGQIFITAVFFIILLCFFKYDDKFLIMIFVGINIILMNIKGFISNLLQATARIKEYSIITVLDKVIYAMLIVLFVLFGYKLYVYILISDIIAKIITTFLSLYYCKELLSKVPSIHAIDISEAIVNLKVGSSLMISNLMGSLIIGIARFFIENNWGIEEFGKVSFSLSLSNILVIFIAAVSTVMFPLIKRTSLNQSKNIYLLIRCGVDLLIPTILILFFPLRELIVFWIPKYEISIYYLVLIIPVCVYQSRTNLLLTTYIKTLRLERKLMVINTICGILSVLFSMISVYLLKNIAATCFSMSILFYIHSFLCEYIVSKKLDITFKKENNLLTILLLLFCFVAICLRWYIGMLLYTILVLLFFYVKKKEIILFVNSINRLLTK